MTDPLDLEAIKERAGWMDAHNADYQREILALITEVERLREARDELEKDSAALERALRAAWGQAKPPGFTWEYRGLRGGWRSPPNPAVKYLERRLVGPVERVEDKPCD
jgi:hypothetical protein